MKARKALGVCQDGKQKRSVEIPMLKSIINGTATADLWVKALNMLKGADDETRLKGLELLASVAVLQLIQHFRF